jgi:hypothetical protein
MNRALSAEMLTGSSFAWRDDEFGVAHGS